jgi:hypothetical protein
MKLPQPIVQLLFNRKCAIYYQDCNFSYKYEQSKYCLSCHSNAVCVLHPGEASLDPVCWAGQDWTIHPFPCRGQPPGFKFRLISRVEAWKPVFVKRDMGVYLIDLPREICFKSGFSAHGIIVSLRIWTLEVGTLTFVKLMLLILSLFSLPPATKWWLFLLSWRGMRSMERFSGILLSS